MFIVRSAFWLGLAFVLMAPKGMDFGAAATDLSQQAVAAGQQLIVGQIASNCDTIECLGGKAVIATVLSEIPSVDPSMQDSSNSPVPFPRPRPDWMG